MQTVFVAGGVVAVVAIAVLGGLWLWKPERSFTSFLLHLAVGVYGISAVVTLALAHELSSAAAAILSSIAAYTLGLTSQGGPVPNQVDPRRGDSQPPGGGSAGKQNP